jgi:hypothetical protein
MWESDSHSPGDDTTRVRVLQDGEAISYAAAVNLLDGSEDFRTWFVDALAGAPYSSYFWETPPITDNTMDRDFEYVLVDGPRLAVQSPDTRAFAEHFRDTDCAASIAVIPNLGGDAIMIVPQILGSKSAYTDLATFLRHGPDAQKHELLRALASAINERIGPRPVWVSTSGLGVAWLHLRLDSRPKYYQYRPFTEFGGSP